jgi:hypothetical protein
MPRQTRKVINQKRRHIKGGASGTIVCIVHMNGCHFCDELMLHKDDISGKTKWEQVKEKLDGKCEVKDYEQTRDNDDIKELQEKNGLVVNGYPTIFKLENGKIVFFEEPREVDNIVKWAQESSIQRGGRKKGKRSNKTNKKPKKQNKQ